jgi:hypothetical protein
MGAALRLIPGLPIQWGLRIERCPRFQFKIWHKVSGGRPWLGYGSRREEVSAEPAHELTPGDFPSASRNTIRLDGAIEPLGLTHDHGIVDTTRRAGAADAVASGLDKKSGSFYAAAPLPSGHYLRLARSITMVRLIRPSDCGRNHTPGGAGDQGRWPH